jgi:hypothetical protein
MNLVYFFTVELKLKMTKESEMWGGQPAHLSEKYC